MINLSLVDNNVIILPLINEITVGARAPENTKNLRIALVLSINYPICPEQLNKKNYKET